MTGTTFTALLLLEDDLCRDKNGPMTFGFTSNLNCLVLNYRKNGKHPLGVH